MKEDDANVTSISLALEIIVQIVDCMSRRVGRSNHAGSRVQFRESDTIRRGGAFFFYQAPRTSAVLQRCTASAACAHSSAKIAALGAPPSSCVHDAHEETSVSAHMNVTRMGISAQSLDEYLDGRPYYNA